MRLSVGLVQLAFGTELVMPGFSAENALNRFSLVRAPWISCSACGSAEMLLAVGTNPVSALVR